MPVTVWVPSYGNWGRSMTMRVWVTRTALIGLSCCCLPVFGQNLTITNARILDGNGNEIERGTVVVEDGRIVAVDESAPTPGPGVIDAAGLTVMPGFIDAHRHIINGDPADWLENQASIRMREFLEAGFTTVFSAIDPLDAILELRAQIEAGDIVGPRLRVGAFVPLAVGAARADPNVDPARLDSSRPGGRPTEAAAAIPHEQTRATVQRLAEAGVDAIKTVIIVTPGGPETETLSVIVEEAEKHGILSVTHAVTVQDTLSAVAAGTHSLVHTPHIGELTAPLTRFIVDAEIPMMSTLGVFVPAFNNNNTPLFRDRLPFPFATLSSAGQGPVNARLLWEAGIVYGYGTDTTWPPRDSLEHELKPLSLVFSGRDIVSILTRGAAATLLMEDEIGTLEPGKLADIVIIDGDPLADVHDLLNVRVVIQEGEIVVDKRR